MTYSNEKLVAVKKVVGNKEASKSQKVRDLYKIGIETKDIAKIIDIRYQFAYQVIKRYEENKNKPQSENKSLSYDDWANILKETK